MSEAAILGQLHALWEKNWPAGIPRAPHYPFGEIPLSDTCANGHAASPMFQRSCSTARRSATRSSTG